MVKNSLSPVMFILMLQVSLAMSNSPVPASQKTARKPAGLYAIWYNKAQADLFLGQPYIRGGQIVLQAAYTLAVAGVWNPEPSSPA